MENQYVVQKTSLMEVNTRRMPLTISKLLSWGQMAVSLIFAANAYFRLCDSFVQPISLVAVGSAFLNLQVVLLCLLFPVLVLDLVPSISAQLRFLQTRSGRVFFLSFISAIFIADDKHRSGPSGLGLAGLALSVSDVFMAFFIVRSAAPPSENNPEPTSTKEKLLPMDASSSSAISIQDVRTSIRNAPLVNEKIPRNGQPIFAVLIDADNIAPKYVEAILTHVSDYGVPALRRVYGDWSRPNLLSWLLATKASGLDTRQQNTNACSKNASDIGIVVDAMDLLYTRNFDGFVIVSSDSDFTQLVLRLREEGKLVIGFGDSHTSEVLVHACSEFLCVRDLATSPKSKRNVPEVEKRYTTARSSSSNSSSTSYLEAVSSMVSVSRECCTDTKLLKKAARLIFTAMHRLDPEAEWYVLADIWSMIIRLFPNFELREYGVTKLSTLIKKIPTFELRVTKTTTEIRRTKSKVEQAEVIIRKAVDLIEPGREWYKLGDVGTHIRRVDSNFNYTKYGASKLIDIIKDMPDFELRVEGGQPEIRRYPRLSGRSAISKS